jgi:Amt family ammonium transporter
MVGAIGTGILVNPALGGAGVVDFTNGTTGYDATFQIIAQLKGVATSFCWSAVASSIVFFIIKFTIGIRVSPEAEEEGLDIVEHGERAYHA